MTFLRRAVWVLAIAAIVPLCASLVAQQPTFRAGARGVRLDVLVTDGRKPLTSLTERNFEIRDNGVVQRIESVSTVDSAQLVVVLDVSGSVEREGLKNLLKAASSIRAAATTRDRLTVLTFSDQLAYLQDGEAGAPALDQSTLFNLGGDTSLYDAIFAGLVSTLADERPALMMLLTDGLDNVSWLNASALLDTASQSDVVVYPVGVGLAALKAASSVVFAPSYRFLEELADVTGGRVFDAESDRYLERTFLEILAEYRHRYIVTYSPVGVDASGWHDIDVRLKGQRGSAKVRKGYFVRER